jgi:hypothetical protein
MRRGAVASLVVVLLGACHGKAERERPPAPAPVPAPVKQPPVQEPDKPAFPEGTRSLRLTRTVSVRLEPGEDAKRIGTIAIDTRVAWTQTAKGRGCDQPWVEIAPHGWVCGEHVAPTKKPPSGQEVPHLDRGELVPGVYGKVTAAGAVTYTLEKPEKKKKKKDKKGKDKTAKAKPVTSPDEVDDDAAADPLAPKMVEGHPLVGSVNVRQYEVVTVGGKVYWKISATDNEYVLASAISEHRPSTYGGGRLGDDTGGGVPVALVWPRGQMIAAWTQNTALGGGVRRQVAQRTVLPILDTAHDKAGAATAYRVGDGEWIGAGDVRVFAPTAPPAGLQPGERWIDVDLDTQILVAFDGDVPVYATMVSTGGKETPTETGVYRMWRKVSETDMKGLNGEDPYSVATVPWTQFFSPEKGLALHTAYWHDQFGHVRSHGCVNLAPRDARWLYFWSDPQVPPGWTMSAGVVEAPGSIVRIRSKADPAPVEKGYAKKVLEARQAGGSTVE